MKDEFSVTYNSTVNNAFQVHKSDKILIFWEATQRLYYFDMANLDETCNVFVQTVNENKSKFSAYDFFQAKLAHEIQQRKGRPSTQHYIKIVWNKWIPNCPITEQDILNVEYVWGPELR